jgi:hypothetical protein
MVFTNGSTPDHPLMASRPEGTHSRFSIWRAHSLGITALTAETINLCNDRSSGTVEQETG